MKIAIIHSYYSNLGKSGENNVVDAQIQVLREKGHDLEIIKSSTLDKQKKALYPLQAGANVLLGTGDDPTHRLESFEPDVVLLHNLFPNIGSSWLPKFANRTYSFKHNYRDLCASGNLYRNGNVCLQCVEGTTLHGVVNSCYKNSMIFTLPIAIRNSLGFKFRPELSEPKRFIVLSENMKSVLLATGISSDKFEVIPNFIVDPYAGKLNNFSKNQRWVASGRITSEKGFLELVDIWPRDYDLDIYGDGPLLEELKERAGEKSNISIKGGVNRETLCALLPNYQGAIMPSRWLEPGPLSVLEFLAAGLPIISVGIWSAAAGLEKLHHIDSLGVSKHESAGNLTRLLKNISLNSSQLSKLQREKYLQYFTPNHWYNRLMAVINQEID